MHSVGFDFYKNVIAKIEGAHCRNTNCRCLRTSVCWLVHWLVGPLVGWSVGTLVGSLAGWSVGWFVDNDFVKIGKKCIFMDPKARKERDEEKGTARRKMQRGGSILLSLNYKRGLDYPSVGEKKMKKKNKTVTSGVRQIM